MNDDEIIQKIDEMIAQLNEDKLTKEEKRELINRTIEEIGERGQLFIVRALEYAYKLN